MNKTEQRILLSANATFRTMYKCVTCGKKFRDVAFKHWWKPGERQLGEICLRNYPRCPRCFKKEERK